MAKAVIDIEVNGEEKLKQLNQDVAELDSQSKISTKSLVGWTAALAATGYAINQVVSAGSEYLKNLEDTNNLIVTTTELETQLSTSFGMASASLLEYTGAWGLYREALVEVSNILDAVAGKEAILRQAREESRAFNEETAEMEKENAKWKEAAQKKEISLQREANKETEKATRLLAAYNGQQAQKAQRHQEQIDITREMINIYEEQGRSTDALVASLEQLEQLDITHVDTIREKAEAQAITNQMTDDARKSTQDYTEAVYENTYALKKNMEETMPQGMGGAALPSGNYSKNEIARMQDPEGAYQKNRESSYLKDIARTSRDTNDAVRGY